MFLNFENVAGGKNCRVSDVEVSRAGERKDSRHAIRGVGGAVGLLMSLLILDLGIDTGELGSWTVCRGAVYTIDVQDGCVEKSSKVESACRDSIGAWSAWSPRGRGYQEKVPIVSNRRQRKAPRITTAFHIGINV
jgi:hypothetical protein